MGTTHWFLLAFLQASENESVPFHSDHFPFVYEQITCATKRQNYTLKYVFVCTLLDDDLCCHDALSFYLLFLPSSMLP
jgi:hypothetical protein